MGAVGNRRCAGRVGGARTTRRPGRRGAVVVASLCATLSVLVSMTASASAAPTLLNWFGSDTPPTGMAVEESTGNVLVAQSEGLNAIEVFGARGGQPAGEAPSMLTGAETHAESFAFEGSLPLGFNDEWVGVAVDNSASPAAGSIYVADPGHKVVDRFKLSGASSNTNPRWANRGRIS
jgi:hypothetical protein